MRPSYCWPLLCLLAVTAADASELQRLQNNPFRQPEVVNQPPPAPAPVQAAELDEPELELSATMISKVAPMVVVNGELLGIGETIEGLRLIGVAEGRATFERKGRKFTFELKQLQPK